MYLIAEAEGLPLMATLRNAEHRKKLIERINKLRPESPPEWGSFTVGRMICHLSDGLSMALGELATRSLGKKNFQRFPLKHMVLYVMRFPKNVTTVPELLSSNPTSFEADRERVVERIDRMAVQADGAGMEHPLLGMLTTREWNVLQYKHIDHHLRQFGC